jgi:hypothetical protein
MKRKIDTKTKVTHFESRKKNRPFELWSLDSNEQQSCAKTFHARAETACFPTKNPAINLMTTFKKKLQQQETLSHCPFLKFGRILPGLRNEMTRPFFLSLLNSSSTAPRSRPTSA